MVSLLRSMGIRYQPLRDSLLTPSGADALPYFRIFNPVLQAQKFDPGGDYIRQYVPELRGASADQISDLQNLHRQFPDYPAPMVSLDEGRARFLHIAQEFFGEREAQGSLFDP